MRQCKSCGKKGLFLKIEGDTGLCLACNEAFAKRGKTLTERIMEAKNLVTEAEDAERIVALCDTIEQHGRELVELHEEYGLPPSHELLELIEAYKNKREEARQ